MFIIQLSANIQRIKSDYCNNISCKAFSLLLDEKLFLLTVDFSYF